MFNQAVDNYADALKHVPDCFKTKKMLLIIFLLQ